MPPKRRDQIDKNKEDDNMPELEELQAADDNQRKISVQGMVDRIEGQSHGQPVAKRPAVPHGHTPGKDVVDLEEASKVMAEGILVYVKAVMSHITQSTNQRNFQHKKPKQGVGSSGAGETHRSIPTPPILEESCFFFFFFLLCAFVTSENNETELAALMAFKNGVIGDPLGALTSWNVAVNFCEWKGVVCSKRHRDRVVSVDLTSQSLVGSLSPRVGNLSFLREFILRNNSFYGHIPQEIGRLRRLEYLELSNNSFSGEIPRNLSMCSNLYYLNLIDNNLTGYIIPELGDLLGLEALGLSVNTLSGTIPPFVGNLTRLVLLSLGHCGLHGQIPESLVQLRSLEWINLGENRLIGEIPPGLYNISTISAFSMGSNLLQGSIPSDIGLTLPKLTIFDLGSNHFDGKVPFSISNASLLRRIYLYSNQFTGKMMIDFNKLTALETVVISSNNLEGDINFVSDLANCTSLDTLTVFENHFTGSLPNSIANLSSRLNFLSIGSNEIHGTIPSGIQNLVGLTRLVLEDNFLEGSVPVVIGKLSKLQEIYMGKNKLTNEIPSSIGNLTLLNHISLGENDFVGTIPQSLSNCTNLLALDLSSNSLSGSIPIEIISISSISISFNLSRNAFTGSIPTEVGSLINLKDLDLSHNRLSGQMPTTLSRCIVLERLHVESNSLEGEIPGGLSALKGLQELDLSQNNLSGSIPTSIVDLNLISLNLSFNRLQGEVPARGMFKNRSAISLQGNANLCGGISLLQLPPCPPTDFKKDRHFSHLWKILISVLGAGFICVTLSSCIWKFVYRRREPQPLVPLFPDSFLRVSYADLVKATDGFSEANLLGSGRFGSVYRGILDETRLAVAVKVLNLEVKGASKSFISECNAIKGTRHRNLLKILSVCESTNFQGIRFMALVYELMANGSLDQWLHKDYAGEGGEPNSRNNMNLSIAQRLNVIIDVASAVDYLHNGTDSIIIHGDLKPSNILLDENMTAHVGDFGLTKVVSEIHDGSSSSMAIKGTLGYIPPEYGTTNKMTKQGDIYSFGILVLEMFTDIRPTDDAALNGQSSLHHLVSHALHNQEMKIVDQIILNELSDQNMQLKLKNCVACVLEIGVACSKEFPKDRTVMTDVVRELQNIRKAYLVG
ncbi:receptor-like protein kinase [Dorcoceras hygrometricum]|uniref:non-specific serine/threonine protein kinase n=1 Tax=Dorcoceras hygrometricum TaxID=472368 RepID=A0A2Z7DB85_9LAMI|nr:receptor-like protein kinase [Dorcoceras hygrometricum]